MLSIVRLSRRCPTSALLALWVGCSSVGAYAAEDIKPLTDSDATNFRMGEEQPPENETPEDEEPGMVTRSLLRMEARRDWLSDHYVGMWRGLDRYFTDQSAVDMENDSELRLEMRQSFLAEGEVVSDARLRVRVDLPNTEKKLKLFFSSDEDRTVEQRVRETSSGERIRREDSISGVEFAPDDEDRKWKRKFSGGVRLRSGLVPYVKFKIKREWGDEEDDDWHREFRQEIEYFDDEDRWGETTEFTATKPVGDFYIFRSWTEAEFKDLENIFEYAQVFTLSRIFSERSALHYRLGAVGASEPVPRVNGVFYGVSWQYQLYEDWIFLGISPEVFYPREINWGAEPSLTFRLEIFFAE